MQPFLTSGKSYSFSVGWDSPEAEGLVEGEGQCQGVFPSCDLQQTHRRLYHRWWMWNQEGTSHYSIFVWSPPRMRAAISLLFWEGMSLTVSNALRPFWSTMFTSIPSGWQTTVKCGFLTKAARVLKHRFVALKSDPHWEVSAPHPSSQTRLLRGGHCLSPSEQKKKQEA